MNLWLEIKVDLVKVSFTAYFTVFTRFFLKSGKTIKRKIIRLKYNLHVISDL